MENVKDCPKELDELIISINLLPKDWERFLINSQELIKQFDSEIHAAMKQNGIGTVFYWQYSQLCPDAVSTYSKRFRRLIDPKLVERMKSKPEVEGITNSQFELRVLYEQNLALRNIINIFKQFKEFNNPEQTFMLNKPLQTIGFNPDTTINLMGFRVIEILKTNNIPIERVRVCPICQDIFWAKRIESPACSDSHVIAVNTGKTRIRKKLKDFHKQREKLKKLDSKFSREHPLVLKQLELVKKLHDKIQEKEKKYGSL